jgi:hypothetical protein
MLIIKKTIVSSMLSQTCKFYRSSKIHKSLASTISKKQPPSRGILYVLQCQQRFIDKNISIVVCAKLLEPAEAELPTTEAFVDLAGAPFIQASI